MLTKRATRFLVAFLFYRVGTFKVIIYPPKEHIMTNFEKLTAKKIKKLQSQLVRNFELNEQMAVLRMTDRTVPIKLQKESVYNRASIILSFLEDFELFSDSDEMIELLPHGVLEAIRRRLPSKLFNTDYDWHNLRENPNVFPPKPEEKHCDLSTDWSEMVCNERGADIAYNYATKQWWHISFDGVCWYPNHQTEPIAWCHRPRFIQFPG